MKITNYAIFLNGDFIDETDDFEEAKDIVFDEFTDALDDLGDRIDPDGTYFDDESGDACVVSTTGVIDLTWEIVESDDDETTA